MPFYGDKVGRALQLAADAFAAIERKGRGTPYLGHLLAVAALVIEHGGDEDQITAAVLHDYLEDIPGASVEVLAEQFGPRVASIVLALSDATDATAKAPWRERKERYLAALRDEPAEVKLVSASDKLHNVQSVIDDHRALGPAIFDRFTGRRDGTLWYYRALTSALAHEFPHPLVQRFQDAVRELYAVAGEPWDESIG